jgi:serine/threonine protein kinase
MATAPVEDRLIDLLIHWDESVRQGRERCAEELCSDCPELVEELRRRIEAVRAMSPVIDGASTGQRSTPGDGAVGGGAADLGLPHVLRASAVYRPQRHHARGGQGVVFAARQDELDRTVAVKRIRPEKLYEATRRRFLREAAITAQLQHPGIVPIYGLGQDDDGPFYSMPLIEGQTLEEAIAEFHNDAFLRGDPGKRSLKLRGLLQHFITVCNTIAYAHDQGVIHRDLKPSNIMLGSYGETLVMDWGLAKRFRGDETAADAEEDAPSPSPSPADLTATGTVLGTPQYMSPEQARGEPTGPASDIFSLGLILYAVLTGGSAFEESSFRGSDPLKAVRVAAILPLRRWTQRAPRALEAICLKALAARPDDRYPTARALADDVNRWLADEPVTAHSESWNERLARRARRNRTAVVGITIALLAGLATAAGVQARSNATLTKARDDTKQALSAATEAKKRTDKALAESEESRKQAEAVSTFLTTAFRSPDPSQDGRTIKVIDVLDKAAEELDKRFDGAPATKGAMLEALGQTYYGLGLFEQAISWHAKARVVRETALGPDHPDTLRTCTNLAVAIGENSGAERTALLETTLKRSESVLGPDHLDTLRTRIHLASSFSLTRPVEAIGLLEGALRILETKYGPEHIETLDCRNDLALAYNVAGRVDEAIRMHEATLKALEVKLGPNHYQTLASRNNLALAYYNAGRAAEAIPLHEATFNAVETKLGSDHPSTMSSRYNLVLAYFAAGRTSDALSMQEGAVKVWEAKRGLDDQATLICRRNLASLYHAAGRTAQATALYEVTLKAMGAKLGPDYQETIVCLSGLAGAYESLDRWSGAEAMRREALARRRKTEKPDSPLIAGELAALGRNLLKQARWSEAEPVLREGLSIYVNTQPDTWQRYHTMSLLGGALIGQGRYVEAEPLAVQGCEGLRARAAKISAFVKTSRLYEASERVVRLYEHWGRLEQAKWWKEALGLRDLPANAFARPCLSHHASSAAR